MPRFYLIVILCFLNHSFTFGQSDLKRYLEFAKEKRKEGDYIHALEYYNKAMAIDSNTIDILWEYAETLKAYKDYRKALYYYEKVYKREGGKLYPSSLVNYGLMLKHNGKYEEALNVFKQGKKLYRNDRRGYLYLKSKQEITSCLWAKNALLDTADVIFSQLPETVNTVDAEFGHRFSDSTLYFSSLRGDSVGDNQEVYDPIYRIKLFSSKMDESGAFSESELMEDLMSEGYDVGNAAFSLDKKRFYFSQCKEVEGKNTCKIMVARVSEGKFSDIDSLGAIINEPGSSTTMPFIGEMDGEEVLFFASDREGGKGGFDIWYSVIVKGNQYKAPKNIKRINSEDNELSPFWSEKEQGLYFSSSWHEGFGGYDIFMSDYANGMFEAPVNIGLPYNSPANDLYYFKTVSGDTSFLSSNRIGVHHVENPTCCSDVFMVTLPKIDSVIIPAPKETLAELNKRLPVTLYFHNDIPNPRSWDTTSNVNYMDSYEEYITMLDKYKKEYAKGLKGDAAADAKDDIEDFFLEYVEQGVKDLFLFRDLLLEELEKGAKIELTVKGFASPLAKSDYNVNLTKRRIASLVNYLKAYEDGVFVPYFEGTAVSGGELRVVEVPFGEYTSDKLVSDNPNDVQNSVYSRAAAIERKIEVQSVGFVADERPVELQVVNQLVDLGTISNQEKITSDFVIKNTTNETIELKGIRIPCDCTDATVENTTLAPGEEATIKVTLDPELYKGEVVKSVYLQYGDEQELRLVIKADVVTP
jgi:tetratricopeptide (TPR) repeat protein